MAAAAGSLDAIDALLKNFPDLDMSRALHTAVILQGGSSAVVSCLVDHKADVDAPYMPSGNSILAMVNRVKGRIWWGHLNQEVGRCAMCSADVLKSTAIIYYIYNGISVSLLPVIYSFLFPLFLVSVPPFPLLFSSLSFLSFSLFLCSSFLCIDVLLFHQKYKTM